uniref:Uncharacterized protein n=1 Tax=Anopheles albimanus TaxID=7167 RepID=A0A182FUP6_ANOAL
MKRVSGLLVAVALQCAFTRTSYASNPIDTSDEERSIIGGRDAPISSYPFALMLLVDGRLVCTASVIGEFYALTAAHCLDSKVITSPKSQISFLGGSSDRSSIGTIFTASYYVLHEKYNSCTIDNDVAVVGVTTSFFTNSAIKPIPLQDDEPAASTSCYAVGWGYLTIPPNYIPAQMLQVANYTLQTTQNSFRSHQQLRNATSSMDCAAISSAQYVLE